MNLEILNMCDSCCGCGACFNTCPVHAIAMNPDQEGFLYPEIDQQKCVQCGKCEKVCPVLSSPRVSQPLQKAYYGWINDEEVRKNSSSGGAFTAIANTALSENGVVFGAVYDPFLKKVVHKCTECDLSAHRKSKYVESDTLKTFSEVRCYLEENRHVVYCGAPCQIAGLKNFLGKACETLTTVDFICHGVPSMKMLNDHMDTLEEKYKSKVVHFDFRPKHKGWSQHYLKVFFCNHQSYTSSYILDHYFKAFFSNVCLRKSCYRCKYAMTHVSDIAIGDFWHVHKYNPGINDEKGISLILINTETGDQVLNKIKEKMTLYDISPEEASYCLKPKNPKVYDMDKRNEFMNYCTEKGFKNAFKKYLSKGRWKDRVKCIIKSILGT